MATTQVPSFAPSGYTSASAQAQSSVVTLPAGSSPDMVVITNLGPAPGAVLLGATDTITVDQSTGIVVMPGNVPVVLTLGDNGYLAVVALGYGSAFLNIAVGS